MSLALDHGFAVLPCRRGEKLPLTPHGFKDSSKNEDVIRAWWKQYPGANVGIALAASGLVVIDIDPRNGGCLAGIARASRGAALPATMWAVTGGNGSHFVYRAVPGARYPTTLGPGLDVKADGYIIAPPSLHPSGLHYVWADGGEHLADAPAWLSVKAPEKPATVPRGNAIATKTVITLADVLAVMPGARRAGSGWLARCPSHDDRNPSCSITEGNNGNVLAHCFTGCDQRDVWNAIVARVRGGA